ncbi:MAG TPA: DUF1707 domain-containing protein [Marmoricola sp.]|nr:DUF1707 domain-containing protein [Marmoricola sp.]
MPARDLRISDADRDRAIDRLSEHYAAGRLDKDEFDERSDAVWTAKTDADLAPIFADLEPARRDRPRGARRMPRSGWFPVRFLPVLFVLVALTAITHVPFVLLALAGWVLLVRRRSCGSWRRT